MTKIGIRPTDLQYLRSNIERDQSIPIEKRRLYRKMVHQAAREYARLSKINDPTTITFSDLFHLTEGSLEEHKRPISRAFIQVALVSTKILMPPPVKATKRRRGSKGNRAAKKLEIALNDLKKTPAEKYIAHAAEHKVTPDTFTRFFSYPEKTTEVELFRQQLQAASDRKLMPPPPVPEWVPSLH